MHNLLEEHVFQDHEEEHQYKSIVHISFYNKKTHNHLLLEVLQFH